MIDRTAAPAARDDRPAQGLRAASGGAAYDAMVCAGVEEMLFTQQCVTSSKEAGRWLPLRHPKARE